MLTQQKIFPHNSEEYVHDHNISSLYNFELLIDLIIFNNEETKEDYEHDKEENTGISAKKYA